MWDFLWAWLVSVISSELCKFDSTCSFFFVKKVLGSCWYLLSILRQEECWMKVCSLEQHDCKYWFLYCSDADNPIRAAWFKSSNISSLCDGTSDFFSLAFMVTQWLLELQPQGSSTSTTSVFGGAWGIWGN